MLMAWDCFKIRTCDQHKIDLAWIGLKLSLQGHWCLTMAMLCFIVAWCHIQMIFKVPLVLSNATKFVYGTRSTILVTREGVELSSIRNISHVEPTWHRQCWHHVWGSYMDMFGNTHYILEIWCEIVYVDDSMNINFICKSY